MHLLAIQDIQMIGVVQPIQHGSAILINVPDVERN